MKFLLSLFVLVLPSLVFAADFAVCMKKGKLVAKSKCSRGEVAMTASNLGYYGLAGADGQPGKDGTFNPSRCQKRESSAGGTGVAVATTNCLVNEVLVSGGCDSSSTFALTRESTLINGTNGDYKDNAYGLYRCVMEELTNSFHTVTAQAWCCVP